MKAEKARIPITDFIKVWCELCRIRIDKDEERTEAAGKTYHPDCYAGHTSAIAPNRKASEAGSDFTL